MRTRLLAAAGGIALAASFALVPVTAASAHDYLVGSDPAANATVTTALETVTLTFNDRVLDLGGDGSTNLLTVTGPGAETTHYETGCATVADTQLSTPVALGGPGDYTVTYQIVSADGHTVSSSYSFAYQPPAGAPVAKGSATTPCGARGSSTAPGSPDGTVGSGSSASPPAATASTPQPTSAASGGTDLGLVIGIAIGIVVLAVIGVIVVVLTGRRKPPTAGPPDGPGDDD